MLSKLLIAWSLMAVCVCIQGIGLAGAYRWIKRRVTTLDGRFWPAAWVLIQVAGWAITIHLIQIFAWAVLFFWQRAIPDLSTAFYFSSVTYTTTGYGDVVLPEEWRLAGGVEALTGILMCGLSTGLFFAIFTKVAEAHRRRPNS